jgi:hypothetical protein
MVVFNVPIDLNARERSQCKEKKISTEKVLGKTI